MRNLSVTLPFITALVAGAFLTGCSSAGSSGAPSVSQNAAQAGRGFPSSIRPMGSDLQTKLAVADLGNGSHVSTIDILNPQKSYQMVQTINNGRLNTSDWYDHAGNLYVTTNAPSVLEYPKGATSESFTYSTGLATPQMVTTDGAGNVYVADRYADGNGAILEYPQDSNTPSYECANGFQPFGVAVDRKGDVFESAVQYQQYPPTGVLLKYKGGLANCSTPKLLGVTLSRNPAGLQIDQSRNLVACDERNHAVYIIAPPYNAITTTITGVLDPRHTAINKNQDLIYVADPGNYAIEIFSYPSGTYLMTLNSDYGIWQPIGVALVPPRA